MYSNIFPYTPQPPRTDIGQVNSEQEAVNSYVAAGCSKIMFTADDKTVYVKSVSFNGQTSIDIFDRRQAEAAPEYVTKDELAKALEGLKPAKEGGK